MLLQYNLNLQFYDQQKIFIAQMGNSIEKKVNSIKKKFKDTQPLNLKKSLGQDFDCPNCHINFISTTPIQKIHIHMHQCFLLKYQEEEKIAQQKIIVPKKSSEHEEIMYNYNLEDYLYVKEPIDANLTKFKWKKIELKNISPHIVNMTSQQAKNLPFQQKSIWFRNLLQRHRISWMNGADTMKIQKQNVLMSSLTQTKKVNMYKQVKIEFIGDKVNDAGGLLREWMHMVIKEMFQQSTGIFKICNNQDIMYKLKWDQQIDQQFSIELLILFGIILGKAIFQKIPINSYLDRTLLRQLTSKTNSIQLYDIFGYDKELYQNWKFLLDNQINEMGLETYFTIVKEDSQNATLDSIELIEDGKMIEVTDENKKMYVDLCIQTICKQKVQRSIDSIRKGLYQIIPEDLLKVFQPYEIEMLLYGVPFIDVKDWKINTDYKGQYNTGHKIIKWFWEVVQTLDQEQLANLLKFSTGSSRTPIHGFKKLESNRGNYSKFLIEAAEFNKQNPYPKGHTCFNRLQLPKYASKQMLKTYVIAIVNANLDGIFGLD